jgi:release factor glutamine methyltransferase
MTGVRRGSDRGQTGVRRRSAPVPRPVTLSEYVRAASRDLESAGYPADASRRETETLARATLGWEMVDWLTRQGEAATRAFCEALDAAIARRRRHEPIAYITGGREFYGRYFRVTRDVLIPRPETELVVEEALARLARVTAPRGGFRIADIGTGSGCLAVTLAVECPDATVVATDVSTAALAVAADNASRLGAGRRVHFRHAAFAADATGSFDLVVSNPPYVSEEDRTGLAPDVRDFEPDVALFGGPDGLAVIRALVPAAADALKPGGWLVMEIGSGQADRVGAIVAATHELVLERVVNDLAGIPRVVAAHKPFEP